MEKLKVWFQNFKSVHHRIMMRYLRKRDWVVFYLEPKQRKCSGGTCWLELYSSQDSTSDRRWKIYNLAFRVFGNTRLWPRLGPHQGKEIKDGNH